MMSTARIKLPRKHGPGRSSGHDRSGLRQSAFTLVELLTVIAVIAVLASLLLTAVMSAKKRSRTTVCTFNLHQICLAVDMYLDEFSERPNADALVANKYLPARASLLCPEDKTRNWGRLVRNAGLQLPLQFDTTGINFPAQPIATNGIDRVKYSYLLDPLEWDETTWRRLVRKGSLAGIAACQLHGLGTQENPSVFNFSGLVLRGQRDGSVVRRQVFWASSPDGNSGRGAADGGTVYSAHSTSTGGMYLSFVPSTLQIFFDDPSDLLQNNP